MFSDRTANDIRIALVQAAPGNTMREKEGWASNHMKPFQDFYNAGNGNVQAYIADLRVKETDLRAKETTSSDWENSEFDGMRNHGAVK